MSLSIVICTYNRSHELALTLQSICTVAAEFEFGDEVIVIDNNSDDDTKVVAESFRERIPLRYLFESKQGLSHARNAGLRFAKNTLLIFFDDDVNVLPGTVTEYRQAAERHSGVGFYGGRISVYWKNGAPKWFRGYELPLINGLVGHYRPPVGSAFPPEKLLPYGANFALNTSHTKVIGEFDSSLGVRGAEIGRGEETDFFLRAINQGVFGMYLDLAEVEHRFQEERFTLSYFYRYGIQKGLSNPNVSCDDWLVKALKQVVLGGVQLLKGRKDHFYQCVINVGLFRGVGIVMRRNRLGS